jgi:hypothetical protein
MKNLLILLLLLSINGCTSLSLFGDRRAKAMVPQTKPVEVITVARTAPIYHPPLPESIESASVEWRILSPDIMQQYLQNLETGDEPRVAYYGLTSQGYENLSMTMGEVTRYLEQILHIVGYYREMDEEENGTK